MLNESIFNQIREIPYGFSQLNKTNMGCSEKNMMIFDQLKQKQVEIVAIRFNWIETLSYFEINESFIINSGLGNIENIHTCLKIDGELFDITYDSSMKKLGFPVNYFGSNHILAVLPKSYNKFSCKEDYFSFKKNFNKENYSYNIQYFKFMVKFQNFLNGSRC